MPSIIARNPMSSGLINSSSANGIWDRLASGQGMATASRCWTAGSAVSWVAATKISTLLRWRAANPVPSQRSRNANTSTKHAKTGHEM
ncbi:Uncharacterised protein [Mycobacteroides abscessus subsp. massiliense]|nr:Uncharacterised protein [Mycobacteroides abscessus subsp. massiliense]